MMKMPVVRVRPQHFLRAALSRIVLRRATTVLYCGTSIILYNTIQHG